MSLSLVRFNFDNFELGIAMTAFKDNNGGVWFPAVETARLFGYRDPHAAIRRNIHERDTAMLYEITDDPGCEKSHTLDLDRRYVRKIFNEKSWWKLAMKSNSNITENIQDWVCGTVLPDIRRQGYYALPGALETINGIRNESIRALPGNDMKEFRKVSKAKSDLSKNPKAVELGKLGGSVSQQRRRDMKTKIEELEDENEDLKDDIESLKDENEVLSEETARVRHNESRLLNKIQGLEIELDGLRNLAFDYAETLDYQTKVIKEMETKINSKSDRDDEEPKKESDDPKNVEPTADPLPPPNEEGL